MRNCAWMLRSMISGKMPRKVVTAVSRIGRKRPLQASRMACAGGLPRERSSLMKSMSTREPLTMMPARPTTPKRLVRPSDRPITRWPTTAPTSPKGIDASTISGWT